MIVNGSDSMILWLHKGEKRLDNEEIRLNKISLCLMEDIELYVYSSKRSKGYHYKK